MSFRVLQVEQGGGYGEQKGTFRITIPSTFKVTYSPANTMRGDGDRSPSPMALRIYDGQTQVALFRGVMSFYDTSLPIQRLVETVAVDANTKADSEGNVKSRAAKRTTKRWEPVNELGIEGAEDECDDEEVPF